MRNYPSFRQLQYFLALVKTLSFGKAAEECFVTQSTLSAGIKDLEQLLGQDLFERSSRRVKITSFGQAFIPRAEDLIDQADKILDQSQKSEGISGPLQIGIIPTIAPFWGSRLFAGLKDGFPEITPYLIEDLSDHLLGKLQDGMIDMAVLALPYDIRGFASKVIKKDRFLLALPHDHPFKGDVISLHQLQQIELLLLEHGHCLSDHSITACGLGRMKKRQGHSLTSVSSMVMLAGHEKKGVLVTEMMKPLLKTGFPDLCLIEIKDDNAFREIAFIWRKTSNYQELSRNLANLMG